MSNILILQGSPRANGNTAWMAEEYKKAASAAGHEVTLPSSATSATTGRWRTWALFLLRLTNRRLRRPNRK